MVADRQGWRVAPYLVVDDVVSTANYYRDKLGFDYDRFWNEPPSFCMVRRNGVCIMLAQLEQTGVMRPNRLVDPEGGAWETARVIMNRMLIASLITLATCSLAAQKEFSFPHTRPNGRATPEYDSNGLHVVVNYDYAQHNHKTKWLLVDLAIASKQSFILHRQDITLLTPDGRGLPVAPQEELLEDSPGITLVLQNARIQRRDLTSYFNQRNGGVPNEQIRFQAFPPGRGTASTEVTVDHDHVTGGQLLFRTPRGSWDAGTYRLEVNTEAGLAALPIKLE